MEQATPSVQRLKFVYCIIAGLTLLAVIIWSFYLWQTISKTDSELANNLPNAKYLISGLVLLLILSIGLITLFVIKPLCKQISDANTLVAQQKTLDHLTGLPHRQAFQIISKQALALSQRYHWPLSLIRLDIDHFQSINQSYGQQVGDHVIQHFAKTINAQCRESDSVFRYEGEEFIILLPQTNQQQASTLAHKILEKMAKAPFYTDKLILELSASGGIAEWQPAETNLDACLSRTADALSQAKQQGRNRIV